jgi:hypothetical protein
MSTRKERNAAFDRFAPKRANRQFRNTTKALGKRLTRNQEREIERQLMMAAELYDELRNETSLLFLAEKLDLVHTTTKKLLTYLTQISRPLPSIKLDGWFGELLREFPVPERGIKERLIPANFHEAQQELDPEAQVIAAYEYIMGGGSIHQELQRLIDALLRLKKWSAKAADSRRKLAKMEQKAKTRAECNFVGAVLRVWTEETGNSLYAGKHLRPAAKKFARTAAEDAGISLPRRAITLAAKSIESVADQNGRTFGPVGHTEN